jgi:protein tyrosine phosphatase
VVRLSSNDFYDTTAIKTSGAQFHDLFVKISCILNSVRPYPDGDAPPRQVLEKWYDLLDSVGNSTQQPAPIFIHCTAGLGR